MAAGWAVADPTQLDSRMRECRRGGAPCATAAAMPRRPPSRCSNCSGALTDGRRRRRQHRTAQTVAPEGTNISVAASFGCNASMVRCISSAERRKDPAPACVTPVPIGMEQRMEPAATFSRGSLICQPLAVADCCNIGAHSQSLARSRSSRFHFLCRRTGILAASTAESDVCCLELFFRARCAGADMRCFFFFVLLTSSSLSAPASGSRL